jgi:hypothetical protein
MRGCAEIHVRPYAVRLYRRTQLIVHLSHMLVYLSPPRLSEVRTAGSKGVAFIEFENETSAGMALRQLDGYQLTPMYTVQLTYSN